MNSKGIFATSVPPDCACEVVAARMTGRHNAVSAKIRFVITGSFFGLILGQGRSWLYACAARVVLARATNHFAIRLAAGFPPHLLRREFREDPSMRPEFIFGDAMLCWGVEATVWPGG